MPEFRNADDGQTNPAISDETVSKVGRAVGQIAMIREAFHAGLSELDNDGDKQELAQRAEEAAVKAISEQGLSISEYNRVVATADDDPVLEERLVAAAQVD